MSAEVIACSPISLVSSPSSECRSGSTGSQSLESLQSLKSLKNIQNIRGANYQVSTSTDVDSESTEFRPTATDTPRFARTDTTQIDAYSQAVRDVCIGILGAWERARVSRRLVGRLHVFVPDEQDRTAAGVNIGVKVDLHEHSLLHVDAILRSRCVGLAPGTAVTALCLLDLAFAHYELTDTAPVPSEDDLRAFLVATLSSESLVSNLTPLLTLHAAAGFHMHLDWVDRVAAALQSAALGRMLA